VDSKIAFEVLKNNPSKENADTALFGELRDPV